MSLILMASMGLHSAVAAFDDQSSDSARESAIRESVVKITATLRYPDMLHPWTKQSPREASGTGVVIGGKRILTNAHMVLFASQLNVESQQSSEKLAATVEAVSPGMDLAVLKLDDESFFDKRPPLVPRSDSSRGQGQRGGLWLPSGWFEPVGHQGNCLPDRVRRLQRRSQWCPVF